ncbi:MAG TPA: three-Cys-motif partner protein TcmP [Pseudonocardiaceae bacterium]|nr:three-Cys-motif partner protein TcmP [Pseudonocardiaceae bacterium]
MKPRRRGSDSGQRALDEQTIDTQEFFENRKAAALLKHEILRGYVPPFVGKTGSRSPGNRVVIMDGFAGAGRYRDGSAGSPAIFADAARRTPTRKLECYFVEHDVGNYQRLREVLEAEGDAIIWEAWQGTAGEHFDQVLTRAAGVPLFMFVDPYGIGPDFAQVEEIFRQRPGGLGTPATEILFRVDASALRRTLGVYRSDKPNPARDKQLQRIDTLAGGTWWRDQDDGARTGEQFLAWFFGHYLDRLCATIRCSGWATEIKQKPEHQPAYYLVFLTRHPDGMDEFGDAVSRALGKWRRAVFDLAVAKQQETGQLMLMDPEDHFKADERRLESRWHDIIEANLRALLQVHERFVIREHYAEVFGATVGQAREKHLRQALRRLVAEGSTSTNEKGDLYPKTIVRAPRAQL